MSSGQGEIPDRQYSLQAQRRRIRCDSGTDSIVWIKEGVLNRLGLLRLLTLCPCPAALRTFSIHLRDQHLKDIPALSGVNFFRRYWK